MKKSIPLCLVLALSLTGCGMFGSSKTTEESTTTVAETPAPAPAPAAEAPAAKKDVKKTKAEKGKKAEKVAKAEKTSVAAIPAKCSHPYGPEANHKGGRVCCQLEATGKNLAAKAGRTITPNKANKSVKQVGKEYVATYIDINVEEVSTSMTPSTVTKGNFVGMVRYSERTFHCKGKTKKEALASTNCDAGPSRAVTEMINFDGRKWNY